MEGNSGERYLVLKKIGSGGLGEVFLAYDCVLRRMVALKTIGFRSGFDRCVAFSLEEEARACAKLNHPNIVVVHDLIHMDDRPAIVMEYLKGKTLQEIVAKRGALSAETVAKIAVCVCDGLAHAHSRGVVHGDVKPNNIIATIDGRIKITDFGLAGRLRNGMPPGQTPGEGCGQDCGPDGEECGNRNGGAGAEIWGTPAFAAPEIMNGQTGSPAADIFALGAVLFYIATGRLPFGTRGVGGDATRCQRLSWPSEVTAGLPRGFVRAISLCLNAEASKRPASALEVRALLEDALQCRFSFSPVHQSRRKPGDAASF